MDDNELRIDKLKIKSLRYTLMELREINYLKRNGKPIPPSLKYKRCDDFEVCEILPKTPIVVFPDKEIIDESSELPSISQRIRKKKIIIKNNEKEKEDEDAKNNLNAIDSSPNDTIKTAKKINDTLNSNKNDEKTFEGDNILNLIRTTINKRNSYNMSKINEIKEANSSSLTEKGENKTKNNENEENDNNIGNMIKLHKMNTPKFMKNAQIGNNNDSESCDNEYNDDSQISSSNSQDSSSEDKKVRQISDKIKIDKSESSKDSNSQNISSKSDVDN